MATILILKAPADSRFSAVDQMAQRWERAGHRVMTRYGLRDLPAADVLFVHVDTTRMPPEYKRIFGRYSVAINQNAVDIDKTLYSRALVARADDYEGPVIVKTRANYGSQGDQRYRVGQFLKLRPLIRLLHRLPAKFESAWDRRRTLSPLTYPIFDAKRDVPDRVWRNEHLMVERFCPERERNLYFIRYWVFFGERGWARRFGSKEAIVKFSTRVTDEEPVAVPPELIRLRRRLGLDYGRIDYVQHGDTITVFDVNKTLGFGRKTRGFEAETDYLAAEIESFVAKGNVK